jgi:hypothetical protein
MNIFFVDKSPQIAAQMLCNAHVRSQIKESLDMLCTAHYIAGLDDPRMYPPTHKHHPCTKWLLVNTRNYQWLYEHLRELFKEYKLRWGNADHREHMLEVVQPIPDGCQYSWGGDISVPPAVVADDLKPKRNEPTYNDVINAYRAYYNREKRHLHRWMVRDKPDWITEPATEEGTPDGSITPG